MPYINGKRVSQDEWQATYGNTAPLHTGPRGENPALPPDLDEETGAPPSESKRKGRKPGSQRSKRSEKTVKAAVADALGVEATELPDLDAPAESKESE